MSAIQNIDSEDSINLDASQELKRVIVAKQTEDDPTKSYVIPDVLKHSARSTTDQRELLKQQFDDV